MLMLIARREFTELWRDGRLLWSGGLVLLLTVVALAVGWQRQQAIEGERVVAQALDYDDWLNQSAKHPHDATHQGMHVFKPSPPLSVVDPGIEPFVGSTIWLQAHRQSEMKFRPAQDATGLQRFGTLSVAWILQVLGPLLVIVLGFNSIANERELGTWRQALSLGVPAKCLLWGKALALGGTLALLLAPALLGSVVALFISTPAAELAGTLGRLFWLGLGYVLYFGATLCLVLAVSARTSSSRMALIVLLGLWIGGVILAPRATADLARHLYPSPNRLQFDSGLNRDLSGVKGEVWMQNFGVSIPWSPSVPLDKWGLALQLDDQASYGVLDEHFGRLWDSFEAQQRAQELPGLLFPVLALRGYSMGLAGTDFMHHRSFATAAETQRRLMQNLVSEDLVQHADPLGGQHFTYKADRELWQHVPPFTYSAPTALDALRDNLRSLLVLVAAMLASAWLAQRSIRNTLS
jgi:ABC-2 type transport system permease protein